MASSPTGRRMRYVALAFAAALVTAHAAWIPSASAQDDDQPTAAPAAQPPAEDDNRDLFANFLHQAVVGKFNRADAYAKSLLANNPDPLEVLKYADEFSNSMKILFQLVNKIGVSDSAKGVIDLIREGELLQRKNPARILLNIEKLGGDPQTEFNAIARLRGSGEYAIPWLVAALQDQDQSQIHNRIISMLPRMGKDAVNPLVMALSMDDQSTKQFVVRALGQIGYAQALPYLFAVLQDHATSFELRTIVDDALAQIISSRASLPSTTAAEGFLNLARQYYADQGSVKADPRFEFANVWYWREGRLTRTEVPRRIFNEIMAMRCCEQASRLAAGQTADEAVAIWLAANIRREAELGLDVESVQTIDAASADPTKVEDFPRSAYFARAAGARYCHRVLELAIRDREPAVALGAIAALRLIGGKTNLLGAAQQTEPLAEALKFPDLVVRLKAALALAHALPARSFVGADRVVPTLSEALAQTGGAYCLVIEPDEANRNRVMDALRNDQTIAVGEADLYAALDRARLELPTISAILLATDVKPDFSEAVNRLQSNNLYAMTPIVLLAKPDKLEQAKSLANLNPSITYVSAGASAADIRQAWQAVAAVVGQTGLAPDKALALALDATSALRRIAINQSPVLDANGAQSGLIKALTSSEQSLLTSAASVLALLIGDTAQQAIARVALDGNQPESVRVAVFDALAESAKVNGNLLSDTQTSRLIDLAINAPNLTIRSAASQALGALDLPSNKVVPIIDKFHRG